VIAGLVLLGSSVGISTGRRPALAARSRPQETDCPININVFSPYTAGYSGRVTRVLRDGTKQIVADNPPSMTDNSDASYGPTDVAFIGQTLDVLIEPGGVFHSMIAIGKYLYVVETNRGFLLRVDPQTGAIEELYDMSIDDRVHNTIVMTQRGSNFFVGTFGEDGGKSELAVFDKHFSAYTLPFNSRNPLVGLAWHCNELYGVEIFPYDNQCRPARPTSSRSIAGRVSGRAC
jgi:hypothetical protein